MFILILNNLIGILTEDQSFPIGPVKLKLLPDQVVNGRFSPCETKKQN